MDSKTAQAIIQNLSHTNIDLELSLSLLLSLSLYNDAGRQVSVSVIQKGMVLLLFLIASSLAAVRKYICSRSNLTLPFAFYYWIVCFLFYTMYV